MFCHHEAYASGKDLAIDGVSNVQQHATKLLKIGKVYRHLWVAQGDGLVHLETLLLEENCILRVFCVVVQAVPGYWQV
jgi:hypothetical protein